MPRRHHFPTAARKNKKAFQVSTHLYSAGKSDLLCSRNRASLLSSYELFLFFNFNANFFFNSPTNFSVIHILQSLFEASKTMPIVISAKHEFRVWVKVILPKNFSFGPFEGDLNSLIQRVQGLEQSPSKFEVSY